MELDYGAGKVELEEGDLFCLFPRRRCSYRMVSPAAAPLEMTWVAFDGPQAAPLLSLLPMVPDEPYLRNRTTKEVRPTLQLLLKTGRESGSAANLLRCSLLYRLFSQLCASAGEARGNGAGAGNAYGPGEWVADSLEYLKTHYGERIGVQHVADYVGVHRTHLSKVFTEKVGRTPSQYLRTLRMEQALQLLRGRAHSVLEIALSLGYSDAAAFTRAFGHYYGVPPTDWARIQHKSSEGGA